jgi:hypothetical protein
MEVFYTRSRLETPTRRFAMTIRVSRGAQWKEMNALWKDLVTIRSLVISRAKADMLQQPGCQVLEKPFEISILLDCIVAAIGPLPIDG